MTWARPKSGGFPYDADKQDNLLVLAKNAKFYFDVLASSQFGLVVCGCLLNVDDKNIITPVSLRNCYGMTNEEPGLLKLRCRMPNRIIPMEKTT